MSANAKFKPIEEIPVESEALPSAEGLEIEAPPVEFEEHTKEHVLGEVPPPPVEIKRGKKAMFPNAKSKEGFKNFFGGLKSNPIKIAKYGAFAVLVIGVGFMGYEMRVMQRRLNAVNANAQQLYQILRNQQGQAAAATGGPDYTRAFQEVAGRLENLERRLSSVEQGAAAAPQHAAAAKPAAKAAAKPKLVAKAGKSGGRAPASVKGKAAKKRH